MIKRLTNARYYFNDTTQVDGTVKAVAIDGVLPTDPKYKYAF